MQAAWQFAFGHCDQQGRWCSEKTWSEMPLLCSERYTMQRNIPMSDRNLAAKLLSKYCIYTIPAVTGHQMAKWLMIMYTEVIK